MVLAILALALLVWLEGGAVPTPQDTGALQLFIEKLKPCFEIIEIQVYTKCTFPSGKYCLYYTEGPDRTEPTAYHTFGWYSETLGCGALYPIVRGQTYDRCTQNPIPGLDPASVLPCSTGWGLSIPAIFGEIGFWLNHPYPPLGKFSSTGGHYFTCTPRNWDGLQHVYIYSVHYNLKPCLIGTTPKRCMCDCDCVLPDKGVMYLLFFEDWCRGGDWDWNDFMVALIPCIRISK